MSRPMALALVLLLLFLTSQGDWKAAKQQQQMQENGQTLTRQQRLELHRDAIKDKIILDLTKESHELKEENQRLKGMVEKMQKEVTACQRSQSAPAAKDEDDRPLTLHLSDRDEANKGAGVTGGGAPVSQKVLERGREGESGGDEAGEERRSVQDDLDNMGAAHGLRGEMRVNATARSRLRRREARRGDGRDREGQVR